MSLDPGMPETVRAGVIEMNWLGENGQPLGLGIIRHILNVDRGQSDEARKARGLTAEAATEVGGLLSACPVYAPTPLVKLTGAAGFAGVAALYYKDESHRFTLKSFKSMGGGYAVAKLLAEVVGEARDQPTEIADIFNGTFSELTANLTLVAATSGNHGRAVAAGARATGAKAVILVPSSTSEAREEALIARGAEVRRVDGDYDLAVAMSEQLAQQDGWHLLADTSTDECTGGPPVDVMKGYMAIADEVIDQLASAKAPAPTHIFVQGGVGALAAGVLSRLENGFDMRPRLIVVEPEGAHCIAAAIDAGRPVVLNQSPTTIMAGLACREVSHAAWPVLSEVVDDVIIVTDRPIEPMMTLLAGGEFGCKIEAGETGVASLIGALAAAIDPEIRDRLGLAPESRILVFGTEGATDPAAYRAMTGHEPLLP